MSDIVSLVQSYLSENPWQALGQVVGTAFAAFALARGSWGNLITIFHGGRRLGDWLARPSRTALLEQEVRDLKAALGVTPEQPIVSASAAQGTVTGAAAGLYPSDGQRRPASRG